MRTLQINLITPIEFTKIEKGRFVEGLHNEVIVRDETAREIFPEISPLDYTTAVERALASLEAGQVETRWTDALFSSMGDFSPVILTTLEGMILERRQVEVQASTDKVFGTFTCLRGEVGWLYFDWAVVCVVP